MFRNKRTVKKLNYLKNTYKFFLFVGLLVSLQACKSSKALVTTEGAAVNKAHEQLIEDILTAETNYKTISGKISLEMIGGKSSSGMKVNSQLKIVRDDIVQLSIRAPFINTEVFRLDITPDSIFVIDRISKRYAVEDLSRLQKEKNIQFNYSNMQSLFTNALFMPGKRQVSKADYTGYDIKLNSGKYNLVTKDKSGMFYDFTVDSSDRITSTNISGANKDYTLEWIYSDFVKDAGNIYPSKMNAKINVGKKTVTLVMSYSGLDIDKDLKVDKNLPSSYQRVSVMDIIKNYIK